MRIWLSPEQSTAWLDGHWSAYEIEEDVIEDLARQHVQEPTVVLLASGLLAFAVIKGTVNVFQSTHTQRR